MSANHGRLRKFDPVEYQGQAHQDRFVLHMMNGRTGEYLEIGASHPRIISNTWALEQCGWSGVSLEIDPCNAEVWKQTRKNSLLIVDATIFNYQTKARVDYLQLDIDPPENTFKALLSVMRTGTRFSVITYETDAYRDSRFVAPSRSLLQGLGYALVRKDVLSDYGPFEDWYVDPTVVDVGRIDSF